MAFLASLLGPEFFVAIYHMLKSEFMLHLLQSFEGGQWAQIHC